MFLFRLMSFLFGHVSMVVKGETLEKFINMASSRGIYLWDITKIGADKILIRVRLSGVKPLRHIARNTGSRFKIESRKGMPFVFNRMKKRKVLVIGAVSFLIVLYMLSSFVWFIDIIGNNKIADDEVLKAARQAGLTRGVLKWNIDTAAVEQAIKDKLPTVSWAGVYVKGTRAKVEIVEKKLIENGAAEDQPVHIVAKKTGLVKDILVLSGEAVVKEGDTVSAGQVLISGEVIPEEKPEDPSQTEEDNPSPIAMPRYVHAKGMVKARIWYEGYGEAQLVEEGKKLTGRQVEQVCMKFAEKEIILKGPKEIPFKEYQTKEKVKRIPGWRNIQIPVELSNVQYLEVKNYHEKRTLSQARRLAEEKALSVLRAELPEGARIMEQRVERIDTGQEESLVRVKVFVEALEEIGKDKPFTP
ncbi:MAG: sporulation protein YqfD [Firmicutes bacterium]|nr:sporulation protein YqfD [Bacillota bacterium]